MASILDLIAGGGGLFSDRWSPVPQALNSGMFDIGPSPYALAVGGPQMFNDTGAYSAPFAPAPQAMPQNASLAGPQPMPTPQAGGQMPSAMNGLPIPFGGAMGQGGGFLNNLNRALSNNSNMLIGLGGDIMSGGFRTRGLSGAMGGSALDQKQAEARQAQATQVSSQMAVYKTVLERGGTQAEAMAAAVNPKAAEVVLKRYFPEVDKAPAGFRYSPEGSLVAIPGGPASAETIAAKVRAEKGAEMELAREAAKPGQQRAADIVIQDIDRGINIIDKAPKRTTGPVGELLRHLPETEANKLAGLLTTIKANAGFQQLQQMRQSSPTGGALGNVTEQEIKFLQAAIGDLEQSRGAEMLKYNMRRVKNIFSDIVHGPGQGPRESLTAPAAPSTATGGVIQWERGPDGKPRMRQQ